MKSKNKKAKKVIGTALGLAIMASGVYLLNLNNQKPSSIIASNIKLDKPMRKSFDESQSVSLATEDSISTSQASIKKAKDPTSMEAKVLKYSELMKLSGQQKGATKKILESLFKRSESDELAKLAANFDFEGKIQKYLLEEFSGQELDDLISYMKDPLVQKIIKKNRALSSGDPEEFAQLQDYIKDFDDTELTPERSKLLDDLMENQSSLELAESQVDMTLKASVMGMEGTKKEKDEQFAKLKEMYTESMNKNKGAMEKSIKAALQYTMKDLSEGDVTQYITNTSRGLQKDLIKKSMNANNKVMTDFYTEAFKNKKQ
ncbi:MAG: hypothetical protein ACI9QD_000648 [Thermoproteota archaeon]|jgi:hypothetical protein